MKLAEALILRADCQKRIQQVRERLMANVKVQEGEEPSLDPNKLLAELEDTYSQLRQLVQVINRTNSTVKFDDTRTIADALAERDLLGQKRQIITEAARNAMYKQDRYSRTEIRLVSTVDVNDLQQQADRLAKEFRELDTRIQGLNWTTDLIED